MSFHRFCGEGTCSSTSERMIVSKAASAKGALATGPVRVQVDAGVRRLSQSTQVTSLTRLRYAPYHTEPCRSPGRSSGARETQPGQRSDLCGLGSVAAPQHPPGPRTGPVASAALCRRGLRHDHSFRRAGACAFAQNLWNDMARLLAPGGHVLLNVPFSTASMKRHTITGAKRVRIETFCARRRPRSSAAGQRRRQRPRAGRHAVQTPGPLAAARPALGDALQALVALTDRWAGASAWPSSAARTTRSATSSWPGGRWRRRRRAG